MADFRQAFRSLRRKPVFTAAAILTIGIGLGVNATIFHIVYSVLLKPLPFRDPGRILQVWETHPEFRTLQASVPDFRDWRASLRSFERVEAYNFQAASTGMTLFGEGEPRKVQATVVTPGLLPMLGVQPLLGQNFIAEDEWRKRNVVLVGEHFWRSVFHADSRLVGRSIRLEGQSFTVLGVVPDRQAFPAWADFWLPFSLIDVELQQTRRFHPLEVVGRLKPGATVEQAQAEIDVLAKRLAAAYPATNGSLGAFVVPLSGQITGPVRPALLIAWAAAGLVLLIACANLAQLVLARTVDRSAEFETRAALGASRGQLIRPVLVENLIIALGGAAVSVALSAAAVALISRFGGDRIPRLESAGYGAAGPIASLALAAVCGLLFGLPACWHAVRISKSAGLRITASRSRMRFGSALIAFEVAVAFVVLTGAGLLIRSFVAIVNEDPGFRPGRILAAQLKLPGRYDWEKAQAFFNDRLAPALLELPGVEAVASSNSIPMSLGPTERSRYATRFGVPGTLTDPGHYPIAQLRWVSEDYFRVLGIPLEGGRFFDAADRGKERYIMNRALAERYYPDQNPVGKQLTMDVGTSNPVRRDIVGVVANVRDLGLDIPPQPTLYVVGSSPGLVALIRISERGTPDLNSILKTIRAADSELVVEGVRPLTDAVSGSLAQRRFVMWLLAAFAALAAALAGIGIYGVMAYAVASRVREFGIRAALGARPADLSGMLLGQSLRLSIAGIVLGGAASLAVLRVIQILLYSLSAEDPVSYAVVALALVALTVASSLLPALRALRVNPADALRRG